MAIVLFLEAGQRKNGDRPCFMLSAFGSGRAKTHDTALIEPI